MEFLLPRLHNYNSQRHRWRCWLQAKQREGSFRENVRTKLRIFNACVKSVLLYGSETWIVSNSITQRLQSFVNKCRRIICRIFWPNTINNVALLKLTDEEPILRQLKRRKWRWIGHTLRKLPDSISRMARDWNPQESRERGRPKHTWRRLLLQELTMAWNCTESYSMEEPCWGQVEWKGEKNL